MTHPTFRITLVVLGALAVHFNWPQVVRAKDGSPRGCEKFATSQDSSPSATDTRGFLEYLRDHHELQALEAIETSFGSTSMPQGLDQRTLTVIHLWHQVFAKSDSVKSVAIAWFDSYRQRNRWSQSQRERMTRITSWSGHRLIFHPLSAPELNFDGTEMSLMETAVTESMWFAVMEHLPKGTINRINEWDFKNSQRPVTFFTSEELFRFLERFNALANDADSSLHQILAHHQPGDQYVLPTEILINHLAQMLFQNYPEFFRHQPGGGQEFFQYAWIKPSVGGDPLPRPVATKQPFEINDHSFFDLAGNVQEVYLKYDRRCGQSNFVWWGGHTGSLPQSFRAALPHHIPEFFSLSSTDSFLGSQYLGFRLVRLRPIRKN